MSIARCLFLGSLVAVVATNPLRSQELILDAAQWGQTNLVVRQSLGGGDLESILRESGSHERLSTYRPDSRLRNLSRPVGRLDVRFASGNFTTCTATIIANDLVLTNYHCIPNIEPYIGEHGSVDQAALVMNYYDETEADRASRYSVDVEPVLADEGLDVSVLHVDGAPGREWGVASIGNAVPRPGDSLLIVHHPGGLPKHVTRGNCRAASPQATDTAQIQLFHLCDTLPGSSGAPIFSDDDGAMVAFHRAGATFTGPGAKNFGVLMAAISERDDLARIVPLPGSTEARAPERIMLFEFGGSIHIGDENIRDWVGLVGNCYNIDIASVQDIVKLELHFRVYGAENTSLIIDGNVLPFYNQALKAGKARPNYWSELLQISIPLDGNNARPRQLQLCSNAVQNPEYPGDLDDFMVKDIALYAHLE